MSYEHVSSDILREQLVVFIKRKFASRPEIYTISEDIVNQAYVSMYASSGYVAERENFGYLSVVALRIAYKYFKKYDKNSVKLVPLDDCLSVLGEEDFVNELLHAEETSYILDSIETLKKIERIIIVQRYYGDLKFAEIAEKNNLNLNTVLSHHRRSLEKLRSSITRTMRNDDVEIPRKTNYRKSLSRLL